MPLTGKQRQHLRALAHHLEPVVQVGHEGLSEAVLQQIDEALAAHELIKVKLGGECPVSREEAAQAIATGAHAEIAQIIGRVIVAYRRRPKKAKLSLPDKRGNAPRERRGKEASKGRPPRVRRKKKRAASAKG